ncbi:helix-turn-helix transcriptional regulator [Comamonas sp. UBA7528]|uniref:helix-turn-helix transcriptional regulator n=1 Tax=Comamonas sp. UBA7528 TaxID=1946391 RepID=UPI0025C36634|nr:WYL domain-containing protein [Comamonas sp. UBA7528]
MTVFSERKVSSKGEKLAQRISGILAQLHQGNHLDKHVLADRFQVDVRTIERDLAERLDGIVERNAQGHWQLVHAARGAIPARHLTEYARLSGTQHLFPDSSRPYLLQQLDKPGNRRTMQVQPAATEDLGATTPYFARLAAAIDHCFECRFEYKGKVRRVQPYRLIHKQGIWYLAATDGERLKNFSVALVTGLEVDDGCRFSPKPEHHDYIDGKDDVWFTSETVEVILRVAPVAAHYFTRRALLPRQRHRVHADGSLIVTSQISHLQQLLPVVRYWLPHVRIVQPTQWHEHLVSELKQALELWDLP